MQFQKISEIVNDKRLNRYVDIMWITGLVSFLAYRTPLLYYVLLAVSCLFLALVLMRLVRLATASGKSGPGIDSNDKRSEKNTRPIPYKLILWPVGAAGLLILIIIYLPAVPSPVYCFLWTVIAVYVTVALVLGVRSAIQKRDKRR